MKWKITAQFSQDGSSFQAAVVSEDSGQASPLLPMGYMKHVLQSHHSTSKDPVFLADSIMLSEGR